MENLVGELLGEARHLPIELPACLNITPSFDGGAGCLQPSADKATPKYRNAAYRMDTGEHFTMESDFDRRNDGIAAKNGGHW